METLRKVSYLVAVLCALMLWFAHDKMTGRQNLTALGLILVAVAWYSLSCWWWPFGPCTCCGGKGTHHRGDGKGVHRTCTKGKCMVARPWIGYAACGGKGRKLRLGRRVSNFIREKTSAAKTKAKTA